MVVVKEVGALTEVCGGFGGGSMVCIGNSRLS